MRGTRYSSRPTVEALERRSLLSADIHVGLYSSSKYLFDASASTSDFSGAISAYSWDFGDGEHATGKKVIHTFAQPNAYTIHLTNTITPGGRTETAEQFIDTRIQFQDCSISGRVFEDLNRDGKRESGENYLAGFSVTIDTTFPQTVITDSDGSYAFLTLNPGIEQHVTLQRPLGVNPTTAVRGWTATPIKGQEISGRNFGVYRSGLISGTVALQTRTNKAIAQRVVWLDSDRDGDFDLTERYVRTNTVGAFQFIDVAPGDYSVRVTLSRNEFPVSPVSSASYTVTIAPMQVVTGRDFLIGSEVSVGGTIFDDRNADGVFNAHEQGVSGRVVYIDENSNDRFDLHEPRAVTDSVGFFQFTRQKPGHKILKVLPPAHWRRTVPVYVFDPANVTVYSGQRMLHVDIGETSNPVVLGSIYRDVNGNGKHDIYDFNFTVNPSQAFYVQVYADLNNNRRFDSGEPLSFVADGSDVDFQLTLPGAGSYILRVKGAGALTDPAKGYLIENLSAAQVVEHVLIGARPK